MDSAKTHLTNAVKMTIQKRLLLSIIPGGLQFLDIAVNKSL